ncbi:MAG: thiol reductant ABC exporter subunit CydC [Bombilactobacillus mellifer]|uniref:thiol reductant ABC exporter subunit CydC n=1 Tax=Bombilactobacillus mellifer TaxID=1218492 RepID=UPI0023F09C9E|nr:thiol reductant ABC exporter subunit CydC [Bombilactobacillus mellifer]MCT6825974.1 thiol reductant ABC exporter subunit CydC [Bombilactobacillus mellifer]MCT6843915.1 thiol reductant ABC exporter subunit CydC [Bombilactobacillus mellifer]MCT6894268.1 thiol reductant ABC exporter subunit CydC [Bombilactobacillus mellifer]
MWKHDTWVKPYLKQYKFLLATVLFLGVLTTFCGGALMFTSGYTIDKSATRPYNILMIYPAILLTRAFGIGRPTFKYIERLRSHNWVLRVTSNLRTRLYQTVEQDAAFFSEKYQSGNILGLLSEDIDHLQNLYLRTVFPTVVGILLVVIITIGIGYFDWWFGLFILLLLLIEVLWAPLLSTSIEAARRERQKTLKDQLYTELTDNILGANDWVLSGRKADFQKTTQTTINQLNASKLISKKFGWQRDFYLQLVLGVIFLVLIVFTNLHFTSTQAQANYVAAFVLAIAPVGETIIPISQGFEEYPMYRDSVKRLNQLHPTPQKLPPQQQLAPADFQTLTIQNLQFEYDATTPVLVRNFNQTIQRGEKLALIGPSGSGKTTLLQLINGDLAPQKGAVLVNQINVRALQNNRQQLFAFLNQQPFLFNTSILNNVRLGNENKSDQQVRDAIAAVKMQDLVESLPQGYDTSVQEAGARFSGGEQQRLSLARILLQDAPIVLLDEPTVGLDPITEHDLLQTIFTVLQDKTIIWVTHHLQGINHVDQVIFWNQGQIEMAGNPQHLYQTNAHFQELYRMDQGIIH